MTLPSVDNKSGGEPGSLEELVDRSPSLCTRLRRMVKSQINFVLKKKLQQT